MKDISLKDLLEAGCHFGHRVEKWHPKATKFIYDSREGLHIIDLAKSKDGLKKAAGYVKELASIGREVLLVATKRQAKGVATEAAKRAGMPYLTNRWIGGFITNWEEVKKNINKLNRMHKEKADGSWKKFPKHEIVKLEKMLKKTEIVYGGVEKLLALPPAIFIVDIKREISSLRECIKNGVKTVAIVDTNADPNQIDYPIPANDDAVGSIKYIVDYIADAYLEGRKIAEKLAGKVASEAEKKSAVTPIEEVVKKSAELPKVATVKVEKPVSKKSEQIKEEEKAPDKKSVQKEKVFKAEKKPKKAKK